MTDVTEQCDHPLSSIERRGEPERDDGNTLQDYLHAVWSMNYDPEAGGVRD